MWAFQTGNCSQWFCIMKNLRSITGEKRNYETPVDLPPDVQLIIAIVKNNVTSSRKRKIVAGSIFVRGDDKKDVSFNPRKINWICCCSFHSWFNVTRDIIQSSRQNVSARSTDGDEKYRPSSAGLWEHSPEMGIKNDFISSAQIDWFSFSWKMEMCTDVQSRQRWEKVHISTHWPVKIHQHTVHKNMGKCKKSTFSGFPLDTIIFLVDWLTDGWGFRWWRKWVKIVRNERWWIHCTTTAGSGKLFSRAMSVPH